MTSTTTIETALERLDHLTPDEIADLLRATGVTGKRADPCLCPIARYLTRETGRACSVAYTCARVYQKDEMFDYEIVELPNNVYRFICRFDRGGYYELWEDQ